MIQNYEFTVILDQNEEKYKEGMSLVEETFKNNNVVVTKQDDLGIRNLAYQIQKQEKGHYVYFEIQADGSTVSEMSRVFQLSTLVLKYLFVNPDRK